MLVLLAFGSLIILFRLCLIFIDDDFLSKQDTKWVWSEGSDQVSVLYRRPLTEGTGWDHTVPVTAERPFFSPDNRTKISPRAAFLLGLPFPINSGGVDELQMLPGIGPKLAARIVKYRDRYGLITDRRTFMKVHGIGPKLSAKLTPLLTFEEE